MNYFDALLRRTACVVTAAANACRSWEHGGDSDPVANTAGEADRATAEAVKAVAGIDPALTPDIHAADKAALIVLNWAGSGLTGLSELLQDS